MAAGAQSGNGNTARIQLWVSVAAVAVVILGSFVSFFTSIGDLQTKATTSLTDRADLRRDLGRLQNDVSALRLQVAQLQASKLEVETQFCSADIVRNLMHASDMREIALLHEKIFGEQYHTDNAYYPEICQRHPQ